MAEELTTLREILERPDALDEHAWVYLPQGEWSLDSSAAVLRSEEVPPELEDQPDAGVPRFAKDRELMQVLPVSAVQDIIVNASAQKQNLSADERLEAFLFYYKHDAFIIL